MAQRGSGTMGSAPVDDLGLVDLETVIDVHGEAGHCPDGAVDVEGAATDSTDEVVMVVIDSVLEPCRRPCRLDAAHEVLVDQDPERVVHRLARDRAENGPRLIGEFVAVACGRADTARMMASRCAVTCTPW